MIAAAFLTYRPSALWPKARSQLASPFSMASARARSLFTTLSPLYRTYVAFSSDGVEFTGNRRPISGWESVLNAARSSSIDGETSADLRSRNMSRGDSPPSGSCSLYGFAVTSEIISSSLRLPAMSSKSRDSPSGTTNTVEISRTLNPSECASRAISANSAAVMSAIFFFHAWFLIVSPLKPGPMTAAKSALFFSMCASMETSLISVW